ncbi:MAG: hypothetical protein WBA13_01300 [Microcoleaceae cyanobacterium]
MTQNIVRNPETLELEQHPIIEYWMDCYKKDDVDEDGTPFAFYVNCYSFTPLNETGIKENLKAHNPDYILLNWGQIDPTFDEF